MGKVPGWAMPMVVSSAVGTAAVMVAVIEAGHLVGLTGPSPFDSPLTISLAVVFSAIATASFGLTLRSWRRLKASWAKQGLRMCPSCGRLVSSSLAACSACRHPFA